MRPTPLSAVASAIGAQVVGTGDPVVERVVADSREARPGDLFVAIPGERVDGHDFIERAVAAGAVAAISTRRETSTSPIASVRCSSTGTERKRPARSGMPKPLRSASMDGGRKRPN